MIDKICDVQDTVMFPVVFILSFIFLAILSLIICYIGRSSK